MDDPTRGSLAASPSSAASSPSCDASNEVAVGERGPWRLDDTPLPELEKAYPGFTAMAEARPRWAHLTSMLLVNSSMSPLAKMQRQLWLGEVVDPRLLHGEMHLRTAIKEATRMDFKLFMAQDAAALALREAGYPENPGAITLGRNAILAPIMAGIAAVAPLREEAIDEGMTQELYELMVEETLPHYRAIGEVASPFYRDIATSSTHMFHTLLPPTVRVNERFWEVARSIPRRDGMASAMAGARANIARIAVSHLRASLSTNKTSTRSNRPQVREALRGDVEGFSGDERGRIQAAVKVLFKWAEANGNGVFYSMGAELERFIPATLLAFMDVVDEYNVEWAVASFDWRGVE